MEEKILAIPPLKYFLRNSIFSNYNSNDILSLNSHVRIVYTTRIF